MNEFYDIGTTNELYSNRKITNFTNEQIICAKNSFQNYAPFTKSKQFVPISCAVINHIVGNKDLSSSEKLFYLFTDFYSLLLNNWKQKNPSFSAKKAASLLNFSKPRVFAIQKRLEQMQYLTIQRSFDKFGKNNVNVVVPSLPKQVFDNLISDKEIVKDKIEKTQTTNRRKILQQNSLFIPCDFTIFRDLLLNKKLSDSSKLLFFQIFSLIHKIKTKHNFAIYAATLQVQQLANNCGFSRSTIDRSLKLLQEENFIKRKKIKLESDISSSNKFDKLADYFEILIKIDEKEIIIKKDDSNSIIPSHSASSDPSYIIDGPSYNYKNKLEKNNYRSNFISFFKNKKLQDFYPLTEQDCQKLQKLSGRSFSLNAMNEILKNMGNKLQDKIFYTKKGFFSYMSKALGNELRNEQLVNNETFKITANLTEQEKKIREQEEFLTNIENSLQINPEWHFKKRLAAVLSRDKAYEILSNYKYIKRAGESLEIHVSKDIETSIGVNKIILENAQSIFNKINKNGEFQYIKQVKLINKNWFKERKVGKNNSIIQKIVSENIIWRKIREKFIDNSNNKKEAYNIDKTWFSGIDIIEQGDSLKLSTQSPFYRDWINQNYLQQLRKISRDLNYELWLE